MNDHLIFSKSSAGGASVAIAPLYALLRAAAIGFSFKAAVLPILKSGRPDEATDKTMSVELLQIAGIFVIGDLKEYLKSGNGGVGFAVAAAPLEVCTLDYFTFS